MEGRLDWPSSPFPIPVNLMFRWRDDQSNNFVGDGTVIAATILIRGKNNSVVVAYGRNNPLIMEPLASMFLIGTHRIS